MAHVTFIDLWGGAGALGTYQWHIGHDAEQDAGSRQINVSRTVLTNPNKGWIRQIGEVTPQIFHLTGTILDQAQHDKLWDYFNESNGLGAGPQRTIHFRDQLADEYEVWFTAYKPIRQRTVRNPRGTTPDNRLVYWTYDVELEVIRKV
jgi:hypothetical protein